MSTPLRTAQAELPTRGLTSHDLRRVQKLNDTLRRTRALVARSGDPAHSTALLLAETRVLVLRMGRYEFGQTAGMHFHAVKNAETPGSHPQHESLSRVYRTWSRFATPGSGQGPRVRKQLNDACAKFLDLLVPEEDDRGRLLRRSVNGLYQIWMYQLGRAAFETASRKTNRQRLPLTYGTLWQRREVGTVPDFEEVRVIGTHLDRDLKMAAAVWDRQKTEQLLARGMPAPLVRFIVAIQQAYPGLRITTASIRKHLHVSEKTAHAINNGQMVGFDDIRHVVTAVIPGKDLAAFRSRWNAAWNLLGAQEDFAAAFPRICEQNAWNNHMLATLLDVRAPEERTDRPALMKKKTRIARNEVYRPSAEVRRMYQENGFSGQVPARAAIELVARDDICEGSRAESQREYLSRLFLEGVEQRLLHKGSGAHASPVRRHRIFCGVLPQQLADLAGYSKSDILLLERGLLQVSTPEERRLLKLIETIPARRIDLARARLAELTAPPGTVMQAITRLRDRHGGYIPLSRLLHDDTDRRLSLSPVHLKRIERGEAVPALPLLRHLVSRGATELTTDLVTDWYDRMPQYLAENQRLGWRHPLVRGFGMVIFEKWHSLHDFWEEQFQDDFSYSIVIRNFQQLNGYGCDFAWTTVSRYLNAAGVGLSDPRRNFLQKLFDRKDEITDAINSGNRPAALAVIRQVLKRWRTELRAANRDPLPVQHTLGLTAEERGSKA
ncbi:MAG: hypothetical protein ABGZ53_22330 [Fuerstiella sp.]